MQLYFRRSELTVVICLGILVPGRGLVCADDSWWAFQSPSDVPLPTVVQAEWTAPPLDTFILAKLEENGLRPAPPANRQTLIRRVTFNLTGLPPTPAEITAFLSDDSPDAYTKIVDRLLASPHYGERWGRHWLDVARYADSSGLDENLAYANAWRYRDYVITAFNDDKPYDQFITEQLAGDLLPGDSNTPLHHERLVATGFLALGPKFLAEKDPQKMEMDIIDEQIDTVGRTFMGLTLGCARCHDHKFDPIATTDYYALAGIFKSTRTMEHFIKMARWYENVLLTEEIRDQTEDNNRRLAELEAEIKILVDAANRELQKEGDPLPLQPERSYPPKVREELDRLNQEATTLRNRPGVPAALGVAEREVVDVRVHQGGSHLKLGEIVPRRFPVVLAGDQQQPFGPDHSGRLRLSRWLVAPGHPLTARVMANRLWRWHFGQGLVRTPDNFGLLGDRPCNQPLLDWLANRFVESRWSIKAMHRLILLSSTYRMSSRHDAEAARVDPENRLHWQASSRRLEAEAVRDAILAVSSQLNTTMSGSLLQTDNRERVTYINQDDETGYDFTRRSIYLPVIRNNLYDVFSLFDYANASMIDGNRSTTTIAPQALFLMNSDFMWKATGQMVRELLADGVADIQPEADTNRIQTLYLAAYGRTATRDEVARAQAFLERAEAGARAAELEFVPPRLGAWQLLCQVVLAADEFIYVR